MLRNSQAFVVVGFLCLALSGCNPNWRADAADCSRWAGTPSCPKLNRLPNKYYANSINDDNAMSWLGHHIEEVIKSWGQPSSVHNSSYVNGGKTYLWSGGGGWVGTDVKFDRHTRTHYYNRYESEGSCIIMFDVDDGGKVVRVIGGRDEVCLDISNWYPYPSPEYAAEKREYLKTHNSPEVLRRWYPNGL